MEIELEKEKGYYQYVFSLYSLQQINILKNHYSNFLIIINSKILQKVVFTVDQIFVGPEFLVLYFLIKISK